MGDALIAGTAAANDLVVATRNADDFAPLDIEVLNPWTGTVQR
jgi:predicted nucleic acid-binding protein